MRNEVMKLCTWSVQDNNGWYMAVPSQYKVKGAIDVIESAVDIMPIEQLDIWTDVTDP